MKKNIFISIPIEYFKTEKQLIEKHKFNVEIKIFSNDLDNFKFKDFVEIANFVNSLGIRKTIHAPFIDLSPGAFDEKIRKVTEERFLRTLDLAVIFKPENIIVHPGYNDIIHGQFFDLWIEKCKITWNNIFSYAKDIGVKISFENIFEKDTRVQETLLKIANSELAGICLDVGHHNVFSSIPLENFFQKFHKKIFELHLHDNDSTFDYHKAVGDGNIDFYKVFSLTQKYCPDAILCLEPHDKETLFKSLENTLRILNESSYSKG